MKITDDRVRATLLRLRELAAQHGAGRPYGDAAGALRETDCARAEAPAVRRAASIRWMLSPTGNLQELSIEAQWSAELAELAAGLDKEL